LVLGTMAMRLPPELAWWGHPTRTTPVRWVEREWRERTPPKIRFNLCTLRFSRPPGLPMAEA
jgi:hypothetical protein